MLTRENWKKGLVIDDQWMAGVSEESSEPAVYSAFVVDHTRGEYVGYHRFADLDAALASVNAIPREWKFESSSECGECGGEGGEGCGKGACRQSCQTTGHCELES